MTTLDKLKRDRVALSGLHVRLTDFRPDEYNALIHAIWKLDSLISQLNR